MNAQHTPGRLFVLPKHPDTFHAETPGGRGLRVGEASSCRTKAEDYANARRLVACWNACEGISTDDLEAHSVNIINKLHDDAAKRVLSERDEPLEALKRLESANARRLAACWNWCDGQDTDGLELSVSIGRTAKHFIDEAYAKELKLIAQRGELLEALKECESRISLMIERDDHKLLDVVAQRKARTLIAKHQPPATPAAKTS